MQKIAIVGSGIAGLTAAYKGRQAGFEVTVFEAHNGYGMDAHALAFDGGMVDVPLRVMNPQYWQHVLQLASEVGVKTFAVNTYVSCSNLQQNTWFRSSRVPLTRWPMLGSWRYANLNAIKIAQGFHQLSKAIAKPYPPQQTLAQFLAQAHFDPIFWRGVILPLLTTICTCDEAHLMAWPSHQLLALLHQIVHANGKRLLRLRGGTAALVQGLAKNITLIQGSPVEQVIEQGKHVLVKNQRGEGGLFDRVIIATQANQLSFLQGESYTSEREVLSGIKYDTGELVVHNDLRCMPRRRQDWTALNFMSDSSFSQPMFSVWVNNVEPTLHGKRPVLQTWNPLFALDETKVFSRTTFQRAVVTTHTADILRQLTQWHQQLQRRIFYVGSWAYEGVPLLESAVCSAQAVIKLLQQQAVSHEA